MTIAFWCIFVVLLMPYIYAVLSRWGASRQQYVRDPRAFNEGLGGWRRRAHLAQLNAFEAFPAFAAGVLVAQLAGAAQGRIDAMAGAFVACRVLHNVFYIADRPLLRSLSWQLGMLCVIALFIVAAL